MVDLLTIGLPFFFVLAAVFGALEFSGVFKNKGVGLIISLVFAIFAVTNETVLTIVNNILPYGVIIFIIVFFLAFFVPSFKKGEKEKDVTLLAVIATLALLFLLSQKDLFLLNTQLSEEILPIGVFVLIVIILYAAYKKGGEK